MFFAPVIYCGVSVALHILAIPRRDRAPVSPFPITPAGVSLRVSALSRPQATAEPRKKNECPILIKSPLSKRGNRGVL